MCDFPNCSFLLSEGLCQDEIRNQHSTLQCVFSLSLTVFLSVLPITALALGVNFNLGTHLNISRWFRGILAKS